MNVNVGGPKLPYLKHVSRVKHRILGKYLSTWSQILGSVHRKLLFVDCFAGEGAYQDENGQHLPGSPMLAVGCAKAFAAKNAGRTLVLCFVEKDHETAEKLRHALLHAGLDPASTTCQVIETDAQDYIQKQIDAISTSGGRIVPSFFFVDPFGYPISIPTIRQLLSFGRTEVFVNLMWYQVNRDLKNSKAAATLDELFGNQTWCRQNFVGLSGEQRESSFLDYFKSEVGAKYCVPFSVTFSPEDQVPGGDNRTKFYLLHFSSHPTAALKMKDVMYSESDDPTKFRLGGQVAAGQVRLFDEGPDLDGFLEALLSRFAGTKLAYNEIMTRTLELPFPDKLYRKVLKQAEKDGRVRVERHVSKRDGLKGNDEIIFP